MAAEGLNRRRVGERYEQLSMEHARAAGAVPVERNFRCSVGEIDLIFIQEGYLVFAEVKYRSSDRYGSALESVGRNKIRKICRAGDFYLLTHSGYADMPVRYDVFALEPSGDGAAVAIRWVKNAFDHI